MLKLSDSEFAGRRFNGTDHHLAFLTGRKFDLAHPFLKFLVCRLQD